MAQFAIAELILWFMSTVGVGAAASFVLFRWLGSKWIESKFAERLESFRHENAKELQRFTAEVDGELSATLRTQEKEFESLSEAWRLANIAIGMAADFCSQFQSYADLRYLSEEVRKEQLDQFDFLPAVKQEILRSTDPQEAFIENMFYLKRNKAGKALQDFGNFLSLNEIFMSAEDVEVFREVQTKVSDAILKRDISKDDDDRTFAREAHNLMAKDAKVLVEGLAPKLRSKFFDRGKS